MCVEIWRFEFTKPNARKLICYLEKIYLLIIMDQTG